MGIENVAHDIGAVVKKGAEAAAMAAVTVTAAAEAPIVGAAIVGASLVPIDEGLSYLYERWFGSGKADRSRDVPAAVKYHPGVEREGLRTDGRNIINTGRYLIRVEEQRVRIYDKKTDTWVEMWGDPHLRTKDGDRAQFQKDNLTIDLEDGTKVTIKVTEPNEKGVSLIDAVAVMKGMQAVVVEGISDGKPGVKVGNVLNNADAVDAAWADGTVLRAGREVDDLTFASNGEEIVGTDPKARWGEHVLDGHGGVSVNRPDGPQQADGVEAPRRPKSLLALFLQVLQMLESSLRDRLETIEKKAAERRRMETQLKDIDAKLAEAEGGEAGKLKKDRDKIVDEMESKGLTEAALRNAMMEAQAIQNFINQVTSMATNIQRSRHQTLMNIARNMGG